MLALRKMSFWSLSWETFKNRRGYFYSGWGWCWAWTWSWQSSCCSLHGSYQLGQQGSSSRWGAWRPGGPASPTGPTGPGGGGGRGSGGAGPPPGPPAPPPGGTGAAISNTQCNNKLNPTLLVDSQSIESSLYCLYKCLGHLYTFIGLWTASDPGHLL